MGFDVHAALEQQTAALEVEVEGPNGEQITLLYRPISGNHDYQRASEELLLPIRARRVLEVPDDQVKDLLTVFDRDPVPTGQDGDEDEQQAKDRSDVRVANWRVTRLMEVPPAYRARAERQAMNGTVLVGWKGDLDPPFPDRLPSGDYHAENGSKLLALEWIFQALVDAASGHGLQVERLLKEVLAKKSKARSGGSSSTAKPSPASRAGRAKPKRSTSTKSSGPSNSRKSAKPKP